MPDHDSDLARYVETYIGHSQPIHWVNWMTRCGDLQSKEALQAVLFENGHLRDLTNQNVRREVLGTIANTAPILELVIADLAEELRALENADEQK